jgi:hypothetical protein
MIAGRAENSFPQKSPRWRGGTESSSNAWKTRNTWKSRLTCHRLGGEAARFARRLCRLTAARVVTVSSETSSEMEPPQGRHGLDLWSGQLTGYTRFGDSVAQFAWRAARASLAARSCKDVSEATTAGGETRRISHMGSIHIARDYDVRSSKNYGAGEREIRAMRERDRMVGLASEFGFGADTRRIGLPMRSRSSDQRRVALTTIESILASLRHEEGGDYAVGQLIEALENTQAQLLASLLDARAPQLTGEALTLS